MLQGNALPKAKQRPAASGLLRRLAPPQVIQAVAVVLLIVLVTAALYLYVLPNSQIDRAHVRIAELQAQRAALERENATLQQEIALAAHLGVIEARAKALGMRPADEPIFVQMPATTDASPAAPAASSVDAANAREAGLDTLPIRQGLAELRRRLDLAFDDLLGRPRGQ